MNPNPTSQLAALADELKEARFRLEMLREELEARGEALAQSRLRMLIAETPLAGGDVQAAADGYRKVWRWVRQAEDRVAETETDQRRLTRLGRGKPASRPDRRT